MVDPETSKELLKEAKALTGEVYGDVAKPALQEVGSVAGRTAKALLSPVRGLLWGWEQIEKFVEESVQKKLKKIPEERRKSPDPEIAVPLLQALTYTAQNETLREMYINLLANSMDTEKTQVVHPSFVEIIKQMNALDVKVFDKLSNDFTYQKVLNLSLIYKIRNKFIINATPNWYIGWSIEGYDEFDVSASIVRISKFGLIDILLDRTTTNLEGYDSLKNSDFLKGLLLTIQNTTQEELEFQFSESVLILNEYGKQFKFACQ